MLGLESGAALAAAGIETHITQIYCQVRSHPRSCWVCAPQLSARAPRALTSPNRTCCRSARLESSHAQRGVPLPIARAWAGSQRCRRRRPPPVEANAAAAVAVADPYSDAQPASSFVWQVCGCAGQQTVLCCVGRHPGSKHTCAETRGNPVVESALASLLSQHMHAPILHLAAPYLRAPSCCRCWPRCCRAWCCGSWCPHPPPSQHRAGTCSASLCPRSRVCDIEGQ